MVSGPSAVEFLEKITPASIRSLRPFHTTLACLLHPHTGGIVDDTVIASLGDQRFYIVTNAACREKDMKYISEQLACFDSVRGKPEWTLLESHGLVALQGPLSVEILELALKDLANHVDLNQLYFGQCLQVQLNTQRGLAMPQILITRGGYTGEDGFEISGPNEDVLDLANSLLRIADHDRLRLAGLGARDSLRLEAGMCLYGHDIDDTTTPIEAGLSWIVGSDRKGKGGFHGSDVILKQLRPKNEGGGVARRRVGLIVEGAPARKGTEIVTPGGDIIGSVTSGSPSPTLGKNIAMGYVKSGFNKAGTELGVLVRGKKRAAHVVKMPFVPSRYWKQEAGTAPI